MRSHSYAVSHAGLAASLLAFAALAAAPARAQSLQSADLSRLRSVGSVELCPDGRHIAYTVTMRDRPGRPYSQIWILDLTTEKSIRLGAEKERTGGPKWSPDSKWLAYFGGEGDEDGLKVAHPDGSGAMFLTKVSGSNSPLPGQGETSPGLPTASRSPSSLRRPARRPPKPPATPWSSRATSTSRRPAKATRTSTTTAACISSS